MRLPVLFIALALLLILGEAKKILESVLVDGGCRRFFSRKLFRRNLFRRDRNTCQYCGQRFPSEELTIDHVTPRSRGGHTALIVAGQSAIIVPAP